MGAIWKAIPTINTPLVLGGFVVAVFSQVALRLLNSGLIPRLSRREGSVVVRRILSSFFWLSMIAIIGGIIYSVVTPGLSVNVASNEIHLYSRYGVSEERFEKLVADNAVTEAALLRFFQEMGEGNVPPAQLSAKLSEFASKYKDIKQRISSSPAQSPSERELQRQGLAAVERGELEKADRIARALPPSNLRVVP